MARQRGRFWLVHRRFFGEVRAFDWRLIVLNMLYLGDRAARRRPYRDVPALAPLIWLTLFFYPASRLGASRADART